MTICCSYIITKGKNKGLNCKVKKCIDGFCKTHQPKKIKIKFNILNLPIFILEKIIFTPYINKYLHQIFIYNYNILIKKLKIFNEDELEQYIKNINKYRIKINDIKVGDNIKFKYFSNKTLCGDSGVISKITDKTIFYKNIMSVKIKKIKEKNKYKTFFYDSKYNLINKECKIFKKVLIDVDIITNDSILCKCYTHF